MNLGQNKSIYIAQFVLQLFDSFITRQRIIFLVNPHGSQVGAENLVASFFNGSVRRFFALGALEESSSLDARLNFCLIFFGVFSVNEFFFGFQ